MVNVGVVVIAPDPKHRVHELPTFGVFSGLRCQRNEPVLGTVAPLGPFMEMNADDSILFPITSAQPTMSFVEAVV
jgi:hypothetical protein